MSNTLQPVIDATGLRIPGAVPANSKKHFDSKWRGLVIVIGGCQSCSIYHVNLSQAAKSRYNEQFVVSESSPGYTDQILGRYAKNFHVITDSAGDLQQALGADLTPRCYIVNSKGVILISQMVIGDADGFIEKNQNKGAW